MRHRFRRRICIRHHMEHNSEIGAVVLNLLMALRPRLSGNCDEWLAIEILRGHNGFQGQSVTCRDTGNKWLFIDCANQQLRYTDRQDAETRVQRSIDHFADRGRCQSASVFNVNWLAVFNVKLRDGCDQTGREIRRMPHHQIMVSDRLSGINLLFREKRLSNCFRRVVIEFFAVGGEEQFAPDLFNQTNSKGIFDGI